MASRNIFCFKKTIHVVLNQLCSSLWTSRSWSILAISIRRIQTSAKKSLSFPGFPSLFTILIANAADLVYFVLSMGILVTT